MFFKVLEFVWIVNRNVYLYLPHFFFFFPLSVSYVNYDSVLQVCEDYSQEYIQLEVKISVLYKMDVESREHSASNNCQKSSDLQK